LLDENNNIQKTYKMPSISLVGRILAVSSHGEYRLLHPPANFKVAKRVLSFDFTKVKGALNNSILLGEQYGLENFQ
jgi:hypothetical protein